MSVPAAVPVAAPEVLQQWQQPAADGQQAAAVPAAAAAPNMAIPALPPRIHERDAGATVPSRDCDIPVVSEISDEDNRIEIISDGTILRIIGSFGEGPGQFNHPRGFALDGAGNIVVADHGNNRVQVLRYSDGCHLRSIGTRGCRDGQFDHPYGVLIDSEGRVIVSDGDNHRLQVLQ